MDATATAALDRFEPIDLVTLDRCARLQTRKDRKYVITGDALAALLDALPPEVRALEIDGRRWFGYQSVYYDTHGLDSYRLAATHRPHRFKVRTRTYLDTDVTMLEVKTKNRRGRTVKHRRRLDHAPDGDTIREYATRFGQSAPYAGALEPALTSEYRRATLAFLDDGVRVTIDADYRCTDAAGTTTGLADEFIIETKTDGTPSVVDRLLWRAGQRPVKISKFATGLAALHPELPANRWSPVLRAHFGRGGGRTTRCAPSVAPAPRPLAVPASSRAASAGAPTPQTHERLQIGTDR